MSGPDYYFINYHIIRVFPIIKWTFNNIEEVRVRKEKERKTERQKRRKKGKRAEERGERVTRLNTYTLLNWWVHVVPFVINVFPINYVYMGCGNHLQARRRRVKGGGNKDNPSGVCGGIIHPSLTHLHHPMHLMCTTHSHSSSPSTFTNYTSFFSHNIII